MENIGNVDPPQFTASFLPRQWFGSSLCLSFEPLGHVWHDASCGLQSKWTHLIMSLFIYFHGYSFCCSTTKPVLWGTWQCKAGVVQTRDLPWCHSVPGAQRLEEDNAVTVRGSDSDAKHNVLIHLTCRPFLCDLINWESLIICWTSNGWKDILGNYSKLQTHFGSYFDIIAEFSGLRLDHTDWACTREAEGLRYLFAEMPTFP